MVFGGVEAEGATGFDSDNLAGLRFFLLGAVFIRLSFLSIRAKPCLVFPQF